MNLIILSLAFAAQQGAVLDVPKDLLKPVPATNQVLARVNGAEIKASDVEPLIWEWRKADIVNDLVTYAIVKGAATKEKLDVTDEEAKKEMEALLNGIKSQLPTGQTLEQAMEQEGTGPSRIFIRVKTEILLRKLILKDFKPADYVKISTIVIKPASAAAQDVKVALDRADKAYNRLVGGEAWTAVLTSVTDDPRAAQADGNVGWRPLTIFPEPVKLEIAKLKKSAVTKPAQTQNGIQIFRLTALGASATGEELLELQESYFAGQRTNTMAKLRSAAKIEKF